MEIRYKSLFSFCCCSLILLPDCNVNKLGTDYTVVFDNHFSVAQTTAMENRLMNWTSLINKERVSLSFSFDVNRAVCNAADEPSGIICIHYSDYQTVMAVYNAPFQGTLQAVTHRNELQDTSDIYLAMDEPEMAAVNEELGHVIEHEVGHAMGLEHTSEGTMFWNDSYAQCSYDVAPVDVNQYLYIRGLINKKEFVFYH